MPKFHVRIQKVNYGIRVELLKGKPSKNTTIALHYAHNWWKQQVTLINNLPENWWDWKRNKDSDIPNTRFMSKSLSEKNKNPKDMTWGYEPVGFAFQGHMNDSGSLPTEFRKKTLETYQSALTERISEDGQSCQWYEDIIVEIDSKGQLVNVKLIDNTKKIINEKI